jgi:hypothetical protein
MNIKYVLIWAVCTFGMFMIIRLLGWQGWLGFLIGLIFTTIVCSLIMLKYNTQFRMMGESLAKTMVRKNGKNTNNNKKQ